LRSGEQRAIDQAIINQLRQHSNRNRASYKAMSYAQRMRLAGNRAAAELRSYRPMSGTPSAQDRADLKAAIEREVTKAGGKLDVAVEDNLTRPGDEGQTVASYEDRVLSVALNAIEGKTINGIMKALQGSISHELLHWARSMGFYNDQQWAELVDASRSARMSRGDADLTGKSWGWEEAKKRVGRTPTYSEVAAVIYGDEPGWVQNEEAVAIGMEAARARYEQQVVDSADSIWRKALGALIKAGRALVRAFGSLTKSQQAAFREELRQAEINLRSGATANQAEVFSQEGLEPSNRVAVDRIKPAITNAFTQEEIDDLVRRIEDPRATAAQIAAAPIWESLAEKSEGPTVTGEQVQDPEWWAKRQYPHPDGGDQLISPTEMAEYVRSMYESSATNKLQKKRRAVIVTGAPAAGKSSISKRIAQKMGAAVIEPDAVMPLIPEYNEGVGAEDVWSEATSLSQQAVSWMIKDGVNIVHERIGDDVQTLQKYISRLKAKGYSVDIVHVRADFTTRMRRMAARFLATGRAIPIDAMTRIGNNPTKVHQTAQRLKIADGFYEVQSGETRQRRYRIISRSGNPRPGTTKGVTAATGGRMAGVGRVVFGQRPTPGLKEKSVAYARAFVEWNKTAGFDTGNMQNFGGVKAKGADLTALAGAKRMAAEGIDANTIKQKTGWFRPKDGKGKWRFTLASGEIDFLPKMGEMIRSPKAVSARLGDVITSRVFDQYPELKNATIYVGNYDIAGGSNRFTKQLFISKNQDQYPNKRILANNMLETLAHEIQHLISGIEHFERGGGAQQIASVLEKGRGWNVEPPEWAIESAKIRYPGQGSTMSRALSLYLALADEVQARDAERMVNMTEAERAAFEPSIMTQDTIRAEDIQSAWEHLRSIPLKLLAAIPPTGMGIYYLSRLITDYFMMQSFTPKDAMNLPEIIAAAEQAAQTDEELPSVHQEFGLTRKQSQEFDKMRQAYKPVAKVMNEIGITEAPKRLTREQYSKLKRALQNISDEDFLTDNMSAAKRIIARKQVQQFFKDEKAFLAFLENGIFEGGFVGTDRPTPAGRMESRRYNPPGGRFGATNTPPAGSIIGEQPGFLDDAAYVAAQIASVKTRKGLGGATIQDKRIAGLKPWNVAFGKLDDVDKLVEGSLKAMWRGVFNSHPILQQIAGTASRYFQFGGVPDEAALGIYRSLFQGRVGKAEEIAVEMARDVSAGLRINMQDAFKVLKGDMSGLAKLTQAERAKAQDQIWRLKKVMTEADPVKQAADLATLPPELQAAGKKAMQAIKEVGDALVEHRIISARQRDKWSGHYLLRAYMEHFESYKPTMGTRASGAPYRAWREGIPQDKRLTKGEIEDLPFLLYMSIERPLRDIAAYTYLNSLIHHNQTSPSNPRWFLPDSLVMFGGKWRSLFYISNQLKLSQTSLENKRAELQGLGGASATGSYASELRSEIRILERVIQDMKLVLSTNPQYATALSKGDLPDGYRQLPMDTSKYGDAAGAVVITQLYNDITGGQFASADPESVAGAAQEMYGAFNRNIKFLLTVANPPTHLRNIYSNILMLARSGTNPLRVIEAVQQVADYHTKKKNSPAIEAAIKFGAMKQTFTEAELRVMDQFARNLKKEIDKANFRSKISNLTGGPNSAIDAGLNAMDTATAVFDAMKNAYADNMSFLYQMEDVIFKVAKIADELERGTPEALAAMEARKYFFDYSAVTPVVRWLSNTALAPFIRYTYFAVPNFLEQVATSPWRLMYTGYGQYLGLMALASLMWGFAPEDAKETLSEFLADRPMLMPVPWRDEHGRIQWIDLGYTLPEGALWGLFLSASKGNPVDALKAFGLNGGPLGTIYAGVSTGVDPFRGTPIYEETDDPQTQGWKTTWFTLRSFMPSFYNYYLPALPGEDKGGPGYEALVGTGEDRYGEPTQTRGQLIARALGVNVYPNDVPYGQLNRIRQYMWSYRQLEQDLRRTYADNSLTDAARDRRIEYLTGRMDRVMTDYNEYVNRTAEAVEAESRRQRERD
jgi:predicted ABC-type ATPase